MQSTSGEVKTKSYVKFSYGLPQMNMPVLADQQRLTSALYRPKIKPRSPARNDR